MKVLNVFLGVTGTISFFILYGVVGALDCNSIDFREAAIRGFICLGYILLAFLIYKKAPKVLEHLKRAIRKILIYILENLVGNVNKF